MELIKVTRDGRGVAVLTLARAEKHNALSAQMMTELEAAAQELARDDDVRVGRRRRHRAVADRRERLDGEEEAEL